MHMDIEHEVINVSKALRDSPLILLLIPSEITRLYENWPTYLTILILRCARRHVRIQYQIDDKKALVNHFFRF